MRDRAAAMRVGQMQEPRIAVADLRFGLVNFALGRVAA